MKKQITLVITEQCNLDCAYCYENHKSFKKMDFGTAKKIIDKELTDEENYEEITIDLFGGEPFLNIDLIQQISDYMLPNHLGYVSCGPSNQIKQFQHN